MNRRPDLAVSIATAEDAAELAALRTAVAERLTANHGRGYWSSPVTEKGVHRGIGLSTARVLVARGGGKIAGTVTLQQKKPWAIDPAYFTVVRRPLYLINLAVSPDVQRGDVGRQLMEEAKRTAAAWPANAIRLDAYDHPAGAGSFYATCGFEEVGRVIYRGVPLVYFELVL